MTYTDYTTLLAERDDLKARLAEVERLRELLFDARQSVNAELCVIEPLYAPRAVELRKRIARIDAALAPAAPQFDEDGIRTDDEPPEPCREIVRAYAKVRDEIIAEGAAVHLAVSECLGNAPRWRRADMNKDPTKTDMWFVPVMSNCWHLWLAGNPVSVCGLPWKFASSAFDVSTTRPDGLLCPECSTPKSEMRYEIFKDD